MKIEDLTARDPQHTSDPLATGYNVISFGRCYMTSYSTEASVGNFPTVDVSYVGENIMFETSGSGFLSPMIEAKSGNQFNDLNGVIPPRVDRNPISVVRPGDINFSVDSFQRSDNEELVKCFSDYFTNFYGIMRGRKGGTQ